MRRLAKWAGLAALAVFSWACGAWQGYGARTHDEAHGTVRSRRL